MHPSLGVHRPSRPLILGCLAFINWYGEGAKIEVDCGGTKNSHRRVAELRGQNAQDSSEGV